MTLSLLRNSTGLHPLQPDKGNCNICILFFSNCIIGQLQFGIMKEKLLLFIAVLLVLLFSYTAISKLIDMSGNLYAMHNQPFPRVLGTLLAWVLPFTEIITALLLVVNKTRLLGLLISACLMFVFTIYDIYVCPRPAASIHTRAGQL